MEVTEFLRGLHETTPEKALVGLFKLQVMSERLPIDERLPFFDQRVDKVVYEMALPRGRADIVIFHMDGSATIIEAKDGRKGYTQVVQGIGQLSFYAAQLGMKGQVKRVRRALMWSFGGDRVADQSIFDACLLSGVIPLNMAALSASLAALTVRPRNEAQEI